MNFQRRADLYREAKQRNLLPAGFKYTTATTNELQNLINNANTLPIQERRIYEDAEPLTNMTRPQLWREIKQRNLNTDELKYANLSKVDMLNILEIQNERLTLINEIREQLNNAGRPVDMIPNLNRISYNDLQEILAHVFNLTLNRLVPGEYVVFNREDPAEVHELEQAGESYKLIKTPLELMIWMNKNGVPLSEYRRLSNAITDGYEIDSNEVIYWFKGENNQETTNKIQEMNNNQGIATAPIIDGAAGFYYDHNCVFYPLTMIYDIEPVKAGALTPNEIINEMKQRNLKGVTIKLNYPTDEATYSSGLINPDKYAIKCAVHAGKNKTISYILNNGHAIMRKNKGLFQVIKRDTYDNICEEYKNAELHILELYENGHIKKFINVSEGPIFNLVNGKWKRHIEEDGSPRKVQLIQIIKNHASKITGLNGNHERNKQYETNDTPTRSIIFKEFVKTHNLHKVDNNNADDYKKACIHINRAAFYDRDGLCVQGLNEIDANGSFMKPGEFVRRNRNNEPLYADAGFTYLRGFHDIDNASLVLLDEIPKIRYGDIDIYKMMNMSPIIMINVIRNLLAKNLITREYLNAHTKYTKCAATWTPYNLDTFKITYEQAKIIYDEDSTNSMFSYDKVNKDLKRRFTGQFITGGVDGDAMVYGHFKTKYEAELLTTIQILKDEERSYKIKDITKTTDALEPNEIIEDANIMEHEITYKIRLNTKRANYVQHYASALANNAEHMLNLLCYMIDNGANLKGFNRDAIFYDANDNIIKAPKGFKQSIKEKTYILQHMDNFYEDKAHYISDDLLCVTSPADTKRVQLIHGPPGAGKTEYLACDYLRRNRLENVIYTAPTNRLVNQQREYSSPVFDAIETGHKAFNLMEHEDAPQNRRAPNAAIIDEAMFYNTNQVKRMLKSGAILKFIYDPRQCDAVECDQDKYGGLRAIIKQITNEEPEVLRKFTMKNNKRFIDAKTNKYFQMIYDDMDDEQFKSKKIKLSSPVKEINDDDARKILNNVVNGDAVLMSMTHRDAADIYRINGDPNYEGSTPQMEIKTKAGTYEPLSNCKLRTRMDDKWICDKYEPDEMTTVYGAQGSTYDKPIYIIMNPTNMNRIYDTHNYNKIINTATSRARSLDQIHYIKLNKETLQKLRDTTPGIKHGSGTITERAKLIKAKKTTKKNIIKDTFSRIKRGGLKFFDCIADKKENNDILYV